MNPLWQPLIESLELSLAAAGRSIGTVKLRRTQTMAFARFTQKAPAEVTVMDLVAWMATPSWSPETRHSQRANLRLLGSHLVRQGVWATNVALELETVTVKPGVPRPTPSRALRTALDHADERVRFMLLLGHRLGMRRNEIAVAHTDDLTDTPHGPALLVHGKGGRERLLPLPDDIAVLIRAQPAGWLFPSRTRPGWHISADWVGKLLSRELPEGWAGHSLRHHFGSAVYAASSDLLVTQQLLGHASPTTTQRYVAVGSDRLRAVIERLA